MPDIKYRIRRAEQDAGAEANRIAAGNRTPERMDALAGIARGVFEGQRKAEAINAKQAEEDEYDAWIDNKFRQLSPGLEAQQAWDATSSRRVRGLMLQDEMKRSVERAEVRAFGRNLESLSGHPWGQQVYDEVQKGLESGDLEFADAQKIVDDRTKFIDEGMRVDFMYRTHLGRVQEALEDPMNGLRAHIQGTSSWDVDKLIEMQYRIETALERQAAGGIPDEYILDGGDLSKDIAAFDWAMFPKRSKDQITQDIAMQTEQAVEERLIQELGGVLSAPFEHVMTEEDPARVSPSAQNREAGDPEVAPGNVPFQPPVSGEAPPPPRKVPDVTPPPKTERGEGEASLDEAFSQFTPREGRRAFGGVPEGEKIYSSEEQEELLERDQETARQIAEALFHNDADGATRIAAKAGLDLNDPALLEFMEQNVSHWQFVPEDKPPRGNPGSGPGGTYEGPPGPAPTQIQGSKKAQEESEVSGPGFQNRKQLEGIIRDLEAALKQAQRMRSGRARTERLARLKQQIEEYKSYRK